MTGEATPEDCRNFFASLSHLHGKHQKGIWSWVQRKIGWDWQVTPVSDRYDMSKDNWYGIWMGVMCIRTHYRTIYEEHKQLIDAMPVFHKQLIRNIWPVPWMIVLRAKYGIKIFDWLIKWDFFRSARESHKTRGEREIAKTEGKFMALCLIYSFGWYPDIGPEFSDCVKYQERDFPLPVNNKKVPLFDFPGGDWYW